MFLSVCNIARKLTREKWHGCCLVALRQNLVKE